MQWCLGSDFSGRKIWIKVLKHELRFVFSYGDIRRIKVFLSQVLEELFTQAFALVINVPYLRYLLIDLVSTLRYAGVTGIEEIRK